MLKSRLDKRLFVIGAIMVSLVPGFILTSFHDVKAEQPRSAKLVYETNDYRVYCEEPSGDKIYIAGNPVAGGVDIEIVPGGCK